MPGGSFRVWWFRAVFASFCCMYSFNCFCMVCITGRVFFVCVALFRFLLFVMIACAMLPSNFLLRSSPCVDISGVFGDVGLSFASGALSFAFSRALEFGSLALRISPSRRPGRFRRWAHLSMASGKLLQYFLTWPIMALFFRNGFYLYSPSADMCGHVGR